MEIPLPLGGDHEFPIVANVRALSRAGHSAYAIAHFRAVRFGNRLRGCSALYQCSGNDAWAGRRIFTPQCRIAE
ncbi:hypothetical protein [Noviherbaspirillum saxi]|uniref:Uncharacterized protein n=1 Tax=Noviherbaspirillum saxi TaxID=2320863 RepID=A0A3A3G2G7_9BURK|nr:hypothetical protein [Noviherbaspirillum saxi]RJF92253.1 hypothetical protein D3871_26865 [Noviherbaspirillum saxi]